MAQMMHNVFQFNKIYFDQEHTLSTQNVSEEEEVEMTTLEHFGLLLTKVINKTK